jgi:hypothetical protein
LPDLFSKQNSSYLIAGAALHERSLFALADHVCAASWLFINPIAKRTACYPTSGSGWFRASCKPSERVALIKNGGAETDAPRSRGQRRQSPRETERAASIIKKRAQPAEGDEKEF